MICLKHISKLYQVSEVWYYGSLRYPGNLKILDNINNVGILGKLPHIRLNCAYVGFQKLDLLILHFKDLVSALKVDFVFTKVFKESEICFLAQAYVFWNLKTVKLILWRLNCGLDSISMKIFCLIEMQIYMDFGKLLEIMKFWNNLYLLSVLYLQNTGIRFGGHTFIPFSYTIYPRCLHCLFLIFHGNACFSLSYANIWIKKARFLCCWSVKPHLTALVV